MTFFCLLLISGIIFSMFKLLSTKGFFLNFSYIFLLQLPVSLWEIYDLRLSRILMTLNIVLGTCGRMDVMLLSLHITLGTDDHQQLNLLQLTINYSC